MTRLIGRRWKRGDTLSQAVLMKSNNYFSFFFRLMVESLWQHVQIFPPDVSFSERQYRHFDTRHNTFWKAPFSVLLAEWVHPIPSRTRQLSAPAPMVPRASGGE